MTAWANFGVFVRSVFRQIFGVELVAIFRFGVGSSRRGFKNSWVLFSRALRVCARVARVARVACACARMRASASAWARVCAYTSANSQTSAGLSASANSQISHIASPPFRHREFPNASPLSSQREFPNARKRIPALSSARIPKLDLYKRSASEPASALVREYNEPFPNCQAYLCNDFVIKILAILA